MKMRSILMVALLIPGLAEAHSHGQKQQDDSFSAAIRNKSTSPSFVKLQVIDLTTGQSFTTCVTATLLLGAVHIERKLPYTDAGIKAVESAVISNREHVFSFKRPAALRNMPWHPTSSELLEARKLLESAPDFALTASLSQGRLSAYYSGGKRRRERMGALACALIDYGYKPRLSDLAGALYVDQ